MSEQEIVVGDCLEVLRTLQDNSVDAVVTDSPYGLEFMQKSWDAPWKNADANGFRRAGNPNDAGRDSVFGRTSSSSPEYKIGREFQVWCEAWAREALRVLKPGGYLLSFGGTRTYHRMACAIEDAGFEVRDSIHWCYGSGFPKSADIGKAIDKHFGKEREVVGRDEVRYARLKNQVDGYVDMPAGMQSRGRSVDVTEPATDEAERWRGFGTALKPSHEPIVVARKPLEGTYAENVLKHGTGALNIDACRVGVVDRENYEAKCASVVGLDSNRNGVDYGDWVGKREDSSHAAGRWPPNLLLGHSESCQKTGVRKIKPSEGYRPNPVEHRADGVIQFNQKPAGYQKGSYTGANGLEEVAAWQCADDCPVALLDVQSGQGGGRLRVNGVTEERADASQYRTKPTSGGIREKGDKGGASRFFPQFEPDPIDDVEPFFYTPKASRREREAGCESLPPRTGAEAVDREEGSAGTKSPRAGAGRTAGKVANHHPCVKPLSLMRWLLRLVAKPGDMIIDPFLGSGTTLCAAALEGVDALGIEQDPEYCKIAEARLAHWQKKAKEANLTTRETRDGDQERPR